MKKKQKVTKKMDDSLAMVELEILKKEIDQKSFYNFLSVVFLSLTCVVLMGYIINNADRMMDIEDRFDGYVEECSEYVTVEKYDLWIPPTIEFCEDEYIHDEVCEYMSFTCSYLLEDCLEEAGRVPEVMYYNESVCIKTILMKNNYV
ncbi:MAG: hypothetical protein KAS32_09330 [Candidatus Peribacteraceae bacterium]|nr:hypothetical protein [Candidatus Peribacteraceae bacterium]